MATKIGSLFGDVSLRTAQLDKDISSVGNKLKSLGSDFTSLGKTLSLKLTAPLAALGATSIKAFAEQERAEQSLKAALQSSGREVTNNFNKLREMASEIQKVTTVGDEMSLSLAQQGISMGLSSDKMDEAIRGAIGLSKAFDLDLKMAMRAATGALQGQTDMLTRYIPELKNIEDPAGRVALVQEKMAEGFEIAKSEAKTAKGMMVQLRNTFGDLQEQIGSVIMDALNPLVEKLGELTQGLQEVDPELLKLTVQFGIVVSTLGPLLFGLGQMFTALANVKLWVLGLGISLGVLFDKLGIVREAGDAFGQMLVDIWNLDYAGFIGSFLGYLAEIVEAFTGIQFSAERVRADVVNVFSAIGRAVDSVLGKLSKLWELFGKFSGTTAAGEFLGEAISKIAFRAEGGPVASGSPYIVGERGPELFVPRYSGSIVPNNELGGPGGGTVIHQHFNGNMDLAVVAAIKNMKPTLVKWAVAGVHEDSLRRV